MFGTAVPLKVLSGDDARNLIFLIFILYFTSLQSRVATTKDYDYCNLQCIVSRWSAENWATAHDTSTSNVIFSNVYVHCAWKMTVMDFRRRLFSPHFEKGFGARDRMSNSPFRWSHAHIPGACAWL